MKKFFRFLGIIIGLVIIFSVVFYFLHNEKIPKGNHKTEADLLAKKISNNLNYEAFKNTEIIEWTFRGKHHYKWNKQAGIVAISWDENKVILHLTAPKNSTVYVRNQKIKNQKLIEKATNFFNNDSFWIVAPYKLFDAGTERSIVNYQGKEALLVSYKTGGNTPGDSYLWIVDENYFPVGFKMWVKIIPLGGIYASWENWKTTEAGIKIPLSHKLSLFGLKIPISGVKAYNPKANKLADKILKAIKHEAYQKTNFLSWSFRGKRFFKWNKKSHIVDVSWDSIRVQLYPNDIDKSIVYFNEKAQKNHDSKMIQRALDIFNNDSFWLVAPHKLYDKGVIRTIQKIGNTKVLHVKYTSGGSTPGDSYTWILDKDFVPKSFKMYVPSMNMKGLEATWEDWVTTKSGTLLPKNHIVAGKTVLPMGDVKGYN